MQYHGDRDRRTAPDDGARKRTARRMIVMRLRVEIAPRDAAQPSDPRIGRPTPTAHRLVEASVSENTRRAYAGALRRLDAWLDRRELDDTSLAAYLADLWRQSGAACHLSCFENDSLARCLAKRSASASGGGASISRPSRAASRPRADARRAIESSQEAT